MFEQYADPQVRATTVRSLESRSQETRLGAGAVHDVGGLARRHGARHALLLTDSHLARTAGLHVVQQSMEHAGVRHTLHVGVTSTPVERDVAAAVEAFAAAGCDSVVSYGGGSAHDVGKAVALLAAQGGSLHDYAEGHELAVGHRNLEKKHPHVAVSTTAGTGAERSSFAFITEEDGHEHVTLHDPRLIPDAAVIDPLTHISMPPDVTASSGMNAFSDAVEAYLSTAHTDESDEAALRAVELIAANLPQAYRDGEDLDARTAMAEGAYLAGRAFDLAGLGVVDSISLVVTSYYNIPHSLANAIVLPHVMAYDAFAASDRIGAIARAMGRDVDGMDAKQQVEEALRAVQELKERVGITQNLGDLGLDWDAVYLIGRKILRHPFIKRNPRPLDEDGVVQILLDALEGQEIRVRGAPAEAKQAG